MITNYIQCKVVKTFPEAGAIVYKHTWLPEKFAKVGEILALWDNDRWSDGWKVEEIYDTIILKSDYLAMRSEDYKKQRGFSDV